MPASCDCSYPPAPMGDEDEDEADSEHIDTGHARVYAESCRALVDERAPGSILAECVIELVDWLEAMADEIDRLRAGPEPPHDLSGPTG